MFDHSSFIEMALYTKLLSEFSNIASKNNIFLFVLVAVYGIYKYTPNYFYLNMVSYFTNMDESFIIIPSHENSYHISTGYTTSKEVIRIKHSQRFKALNYYLLHLCKISIPQLQEIMEIEDNKNSSYSHSQVEEYILMPYQNKKICICDKRNITLEISIISKDSVDENEKSKKTSHSYKKYLYKLSTSGNDPMVLHDFLEECTTAHNEYIKKITDKQYIFEYTKTEYDDNDNKCARYIETVFKSNKYLDKNIFFPEKADFLQQLDKFIFDKEKHKAIYAESGQPYKHTIVLYGEPGAGKTCIIRGILNRTGRDGVYVPWSNIKKCYDLASILRCTKFNGKIREPKDLVFIFEDFDANSSKVLKTRKPEQKHVNNEEFEILTSSLSDEVLEKNSLPKDILSQIKSLKEYATNITNVSLKPMDDEITLEYVLNMFDGVVEQNDAIIIFTTNHLDDIDPALLRPGRVDMMLELKRATVETIKEMLQYHYKIPKEELENKEGMKLLKDYEHSPAYIQNQITKINNIDELLERLCNRI